MVMQACIDDSGSSGSSTEPLFVLGGFIASADQWTVFSDEWQSTLKRNPALDYFKMTEAAGLRCQFDKTKGWDETKRVDRVLALAKIVRKHAQIRIDVSMKHADFNQFLKSLPAIQRSFATDSPYVFLAEGLMATAAKAAPAFGLEEPIDFIFDEQQGFFEELRQRWASFKEALTPGVGHFLSSRPIDRDDKVFKPLQAADLYAWHVRKWLTGGLTIADPVMQLIDPIKSIYRHFNSYFMGQVHAELLKRTSQFKAQNPNVPLVHVGKNARERKRLRTRK